MSATKRVYIIGSGPAGLSAAHVLNKRGYEVHIIERADLIGGKVHSFEKEGRSHEHGIHGWWTNYKNFDRLLSENGIDEAKIFRIANGSTLLLPDGRREALSTLKRNWPSPFFLLIQVLRSPLFKFMEMFSLIKFGILLFAFRHKEDYAYFDTYSFQELMDNCKVGKNFQRYLFEPFILSFDFTTSQRVSAACGLSGFQFYVLRDQRSILARWLLNTPSVCIFSPLREQLKKKGVFFHLETKLNKLVFENDRVKKMVMDTKSPELQAQAKPASIKIQKSLIPAGDFSYLPEHSIFVGRFNNKINVLSSRCTHQGCTVRWKSEEKIFLCPCHGGKYNADGKQIQGPPPQPLFTPSFTEENDSITLTETVVELDAEQVIIATDVIAARDIFRSSLPPTHALNANLSKLDGTPVIVVRLWFNTQNLEPDIESALTPEFGFIDNFFNLSTFSDVYTPQGHLIEVQSYRVFEHIDKDDDSIMALVWADLALINRGYTMSVLAGKTISRHRNLFTRYAPGLNRFRPSATTSLGGVYLAGDWTSTETSVWMMERGIVSGIRAANALLKHKGEEVYPLISLSREGIFLRLTRGVCRFLRRFIWHTNISHAQPEPSGIFRGKVISNVFANKDKQTGLYFKKPESLSWRDWTIMLLHTGAEIEHALMNQYLYTAYSINAIPGTSSYESLKSFQETIIGIAVEEMGHFISVQNILLFIGAPINMDREDFPLRTEFYPFPFELLPFSKAVVAKYVIAEMPDKKTDEIQQLFQAVNRDNDPFLNRVGALYEDVITILKDPVKLPETLLDKAILSRPVIDKEDWETRASVVIEKVSNRQEAIKVLEEIAEQGEGNQDADDSHFSRLLDIHRKFDLIDEAARATVAYPVPANPRTEASPDKSNVITHPSALRWNQLFNQCYRQILSLLTHLLTLQDFCYGTAGKKEVKKTLTLLSVQMMRGPRDKAESGLKAIAQKIFTLPLKETAMNNANAGPTFEMPYTWNFPVNEDSKWNSHLHLAEAQLELLAKIEAAETPTSLTGSLKVLNQNLIAQAKNFISKIPSIETQ